MAVAELNNLHKLGKTLMSTTANADIISELITKVNLAYNNFTFLSSDLAYRKVAYDVTHVAPKKSG